MSATLLARGRGQAPKPRSGASKTPGLRSAPGQKRIGQAVRLLPHLCHDAALAASTGFWTSDVAPAPGGEVWTASNASGAR